MIRIADRFEAERLLGVGLYTPSEAAMYARVSTQLMTRWIHGTAQGSSVVEAELRDTTDKIVTFLDLVQALAIRRIRNERPGISLQKIRQAYITAKETFNEEYPFALESTRIGVFGPPDKPQQQEIWLCVGENEEGVHRYFQLTGKKCKNQLIGEVVRTYTSRLLFDDTNKLAMKYFPYPTVLDPSGQNRIVMEPRVRFGEPYIESCGYTAQTLFNAYQSEGGVERAAEIYGVAPEEITLAIDYFDYLQANPKAA